MKKILIIHANPKPHSFTDALAEAYRKGAEESGATVKQLTLHELQFDLSLKYGYAQTQPLEPDLVAAQTAIKWADHVVWIYPIWWGAMPALLKGFIDRVLLPGFAFNYRKDSPLWDKYLTGKTARMITTMDTPNWYDWLVYRRAGHRVMKQTILGFCGFKPVRITSIAPLRKSSDAFRAKWLAKVMQLGGAFR